MDLGKDQDDIMKPLNRHYHLLLLMLFVIIALSAALPARSSRSRRWHRPNNSVDAWAELINGNARYCESRRENSIDTTHDADHRHELVHGQHPIAAVLCCSDSRVCPEFIFDQRPGSIFEIRNAGNLVDDDVMASFEYAVEHLHVPLIVIMSHTRCGAIQAVHDADDKPLHDHLRALQLHMQGLKEEIHRTHHDHSQACLDRLSKENSLQQARLLLKESPIIRHAVEQGKVHLMVAIYDLETGQVEVLNDR
jgi:carbonic anhydrase